MVGPAAEGGAGPRRRGAGAEEGGTMAVALIFDGPGVTQAQYDQVRAEVVPDNRPPAGMRYHVAGPTETGWLVVEVWESPEAADRFFRETLGQALQRANISVQPRVVPVHNTIQP